MNGIAKAMKISLLMAITHLIKAYEFLAENRKRRGHSKMIGKNNVQGEI